MTTDRELLELAADNSLEGGVDIETLRSVLDYNHESGALTWKRRPLEMFSSLRACAVWNGRYAGKLAGYDKGDGYLQVEIFNRIHRAHRVAFAIHHGRWPLGEVDHRNLIRDDNRINNLREATRSGNISNTPLSRNNSSGIKGVYWDKRRSKWCASIGVNMRKIHVGYFDSLDAAADAIRGARELYHGEFHRHVDERVTP